jgi:ubiquitin carboxyl-terminal hydrolase 4/11
MYLTLPLPEQKKWRHDIFYVPWDLSKPHVKVRREHHLSFLDHFLTSSQVPVEIGRDASFKELKNLLGRWMGAMPDHVIFFLHFLPQAR